MVGISALDKIEACRHIVANLIYLSQQMTETLASSMLYGPDNFNLYQNPRNSHLKKGQEEPS